MSKTFLNLLEYSIIPAFLIIIGKYLGILFSARFLGVTLTSTQFFEGVVLANQNISAADLLVVSSYSDIFMYFFIASYFTFLVIKSVFNKSKELKFSLLDKLGDKSIPGLFNAAYEIYKAIPITLFFLWLCTFLVIINSALNITYLWVGVVSITSTIILTIIFFQDVIREMGSFRKKITEIKLD